MVRSTDWAAWTSAGSNARYDDSGMGKKLAEVGGLAADGAIGGEDDLLDLHLGFGELLLDRLQLLQRVLERQRGNILRQYGFFRQFGLSEGRSMVARAYCQRA